MSWADAKKAAQESGGRYVQLRNPGDRATIAVLGEPTVETKDGRNGPYRVTVLRVLLRGIDAEKICELFASQAAGLIDLQPSHPADTWDYECTVVDAGTDKNGRPRTRHDWRAVPRDPETQEMIDALHSDEVPFA